MNELTIFNYENKEVRTIVDEKGNPWWVAKDVCDILEYKDNRVAMRKISDKNKGAYPLPTPGGVQKFQIVSEAGLYKLIMRSDKPEAERFQDWVMEEVLPSIRKTGSYSKENIDPIVAMLDVVKEVRLKQLSMDRELQEIKANQNKTIEYFSKKADLTNVLPETKPKTLRANLNQIVRSYARNNDVAYNIVWSELHQEFYYRYRINISLRAKNAGVKILDYAENNGMLEDLVSLANELFC